MYYTATIKSPGQQKKLQIVKLLLKGLISFCCIGLAVACTLKEKKVMKTDNYRMGRLKARLTNQTSKDKNAATGVQPLNFGGKREGLMYVPKGYNKNRPAALAVMLHGAGGQAEHGLSLLQNYADDKNIILLAPASQAATWDVIVSNFFGPDAVFIDKALEFVFENYAIDSSRIAIGGFSDGASYALCLGLSNGDLFTHIIAFSPGFFHTFEDIGKPSVFISHGTQDNVLPIDPCSRRIVSKLKMQGFEVNYMEFDGAHEIPANISQSGVNWFATGGMNKD